MNISEKLRDIRFALEDIDDVTTNPELKAKIAEILLLVREAYEIRKQELGRTDVQSSRKPIKSAKNFAEKTPHDITLDNGKQIQKGTVFNVDYDGNEQGDYVLGISVNGLGKAQLRFDSENDAFNQGWIVESSRRTIKSFRDTSNEDASNDYGFYWEGENIYDKDGNHWYYGDYINGNTGIEPYSSYMQAVKETEDSIRDSFTEDEIPDPEDYAYQLVDFAVETLPNPGKFIKEYEGF